MNSLQTKKNGLRKQLAGYGVLKRGGLNEHSDYKYFSEAQYKMLFVDLFSAHGLELQATTVSVESIEGTKNMPYGRRVTVKYILKDSDTNEFEESVFVGEGMDNMDKAIYKAYTGSLKYYFATTFNVATGDDAEKSGKVEGYEFIQPHQIEVIKNFYKPDDMEKLLKANKITKIEDMPFEKAADYLEKIRVIIKAKSPKNETPKAEIMDSDMIQIPGPSDENDGI